MSVAEAFLDTNVVLYLFSADAAKAGRAEELLTAGARISVQVLNELANVARRKLDLSWQQIIAISATLRSLCRVEPVTVETHTLGLRVARRYEIPVYDGTIVAAALLSGCSTLYTEDMQHGQVIEHRLVLRNPFLPR